MGKHIVVIRGDGTIRHSAPKSVVWGFFYETLPSLDQLHAEIRYRMCLLDAARDNDGRADLTPLGMTRPRRDGGVHYELYISDKLLT